MKTKEQIIEWLKGQEWFEELCYNAGFIDEGELSDYIQKIYPQYVILGAFGWAEKGYDYWYNCHREYLKWLKSNDEQSVPNDQNFVFEGGKREAPFYIVFMDDVRLGVVQCFFPVFEQAMKKAHEMAKIKNCKAYVLAAVGEIQPDVVTKAVSINDMESKS